VALWRWFGGGEALPPGDLYFDLFSEEQNVLSGERAYSHLSALGLTFRNEKFVEFSPAERREC
jgi:hypothetical protein